MRYWSEIATFSYHLAFNTLVEGDPLEAWTTVAVLGFSFGGPLGWRHFHLGGHTTNTIALNYRVCNRLYQIIHINYTHEHIHTSKFISYYVMYIIVTTHENIEMTTNVKL